MIPIKVGGKPRQNPDSPSSSMICFATVNGCPRLPEFRAADELCNCVLMTSSGLVRHDATVPAAPPENRLQKIEYATYESTFKDQFITATTKNMDRQTHLKAAIWVDDILLTAVEAPPLGCSENRTPLRLCD
jgi:hypothetical protein